MHCSSTVKVFAYSALQVSVVLTFYITGCFTDGSSAIFSLLCRKVTDTREKLFTFQIQDTENVDKSEFMNSLAKNIANSFCRTDYVSRTYGYGYTVYGCSWWLIFSYVHHIPTDSVNVYCCQCASRLVCCSTSNNRSLLAEEPTYDIQWFGSNSVPRQILS